MDYELKHGNSDQSVLQQALKNGEELPDFIKNKPYLIDDSLQFYLQAFFILESERQVGFALGSIPVTRIIEYGKHLGYENYSDMQDFVYIIRRLDIHTVNYYNNLNKK